MTNKQKNKMSSLINKKKAHNYYIAKNATEPYYSSASLSSWFPDLLVRAWNKRVNNKFFSSLPFFWLTDIIWGFLT